MAEAQYPSIDSEAGPLHELARAVEALIFAADEPVTAGRIADVFAEVSGLDRPTPEDVEAAVEHINAAYMTLGSALRIRSWAGGYRLATTHEVSPYLKVFFSTDRQRRLSRSLMEVLAIVAYRQPATKPEIDFVRGVDSDYALRKLLELGLVDVVGRGDAIGRPLLYGTTQQFLEAFGLESLESLPNLRELEELLADPAFNRERARLLMVNGLPEEGEREMERGEEPEGSE